MKKIPLPIRRLLKNKNLRLVNFLGLAVLFACLLTSYAYLRWELSFDKYHSHADRIVRMSLQFEDEDKADGRIYGSFMDKIISNTPQVETFLKFSMINTGLININGQNQIINDICLTNHAIFDVFDFSFIEGNKEAALAAPDNAIISERMALQLFGTTDVVGKELGLSSRKISESKIFISGVYKNIPQNSHWDTNLILHYKDMDERFSFYYLLTKEGVNIHLMEETINNLYKEEYKERQKDHIELIPLTDIHLYSHNAKELKVNGNVNYIYLLVGANILLLITILFNLWLNANVIFSHNKKYYQLLKFNGASSYQLLNDEIRINMYMLIPSILAGRLLSAFIADYFALGNSMPIKYEITFAFAFLSVCLLVALLPILFNISSTLLFDNNNSSKRFSYSNIKYMLIVQYSLVIFILIVSVTINSQVSLIHSSQLDKHSNQLIVMDEQPTDVVRNFKQFKAQLERFPEIDSVTASMQLPGESIRDGLTMKKENGESVFSPMLVVGEDFFSFFDIKLVAGKIFSPLTQSYNEEQSELDSYMNTQMKTDKKEQVIINETALKLLGYQSAEEAIGKEININHQIVSAQKTIIRGVSENFTYSNIYEENTPLVLFQRSAFTHCFMIRFTHPENENNLAILNYAWREVNPNYAMSFGYLQDVYNKIYKNELIAEKTINLFSLLCLIITLMGLIIFMWFMIRMRTKEIAIRKVNGANNTEIILLLNTSLLKWIAFSALFAVPLAMYATNKWLENFAYQVQLSWWVYAGTCMMVVVISLLAVSYQSLKASRINPIESIKIE